MHISNSLRVQYKGWQPNRYKSEGEHPKKKVRYKIWDITNTTNEVQEEEALVGQDSKKSERHCKKCKQIGHYAPRYPNV